MTMRIAFLGLGRMGRPMAAHLVDGNDEVVVWNRTENVAREFATDRDVRVAATPAEAARGADVVITMLADDDAVRATLLGPDGVRAGVQTGAVVVDMSTIAPATSRELATAFEDAGAGFVDAPVSGSIPAARGATLTIMAGGRTDSFVRARPVLERLGSPVIHLGPSGSGSAMKLAVNALLHSFNGALAESLHVAERAGVDVEAAYQVLKESAVAAPYVGYKESHFLRPTDAPVNFTVALAAKDLRLAVELGRSVGTTLSSAATALEVLEQAGASGYDTADESAVLQFLRDRTKE